MAISNLTGTPPFRKLRGYAFDPITSLDLDTAEINEIIYKVRWENDLKKGPCGTYIKVLDRDPASDAVYRPVDLNDPAILASDGLAPSETNPQFHQQMVYAVIMTTISNFEKALGRKVMWRAQELKDDDTGLTTYHYTSHLLVYPHGLRDQNAYYSSDRVCLIFGYYNATPLNGALYLPGGIVYSCLSHDIIAHETTHALLDGMYSRFMELTNPDMPGFHEGFADIVALLQHFTFPEIVKNQLRKVRGALDAENLLVKLAVEFGLSTGERRSLRDAIGVTDKKNNWMPKPPSTLDYERAIECHDRGALLVSAVFDAFLAIYKSRTADLMRIATGGTGIVLAGELHPDLIGRLADEAAKTASHVLTMCIRALDYCPPVDLNYGDYLRGLITADKELVPDDVLHYRIAMINAFRKRGIFPQGVPNLSVETLTYPVIEEIKSAGFRKLNEYLRIVKEILAYKTDREKIFEATVEAITGERRGKPGKKGILNFLFDDKGKAFDADNLERITGLVFTDDYQSLGIPTSKSRKVGPSVEVHSLRIHHRIAQDGTLQNQIILTLCQRATVSIGETNGSVKLTPYNKNNRRDAAGKTMIFRGGCTLIFHLNNLCLHFAIRKPIFEIVNGGRKRLHKGRLHMQYECMYGGLSEKIGLKGHEAHGEVFSFMHQPNHDIL